MGSSRWNNVFFYFSEDTGVDGCAKAPVNGEHKM